VIPPPGERGGFLGAAPMPVPAPWPDPGQPTLAGRGSASGRLTTDLSQAGEQPPGQACCAGLARRGEVSCSSDVATLPTGAAIPPSPQGERPLAGFLSVAIRQGT